jgi:drug/metabolite transporter (DMT)-like permease
MKLRIGIALLTIYIIWGSTYLAIRFAVETIPPFLMAATRFLIPGLLLVGWRLLSGDPFPSRRQWASAAIIGLLLLLGGNGLVSWSERRIDSGIAALLVGTVPIWMVLVDSLFVNRRAPHWLGLAGLLTGFLGIVLLVGPDDLLRGASHYDLLGIGAVTLGALLWSIGSVYSQKAYLPRSPLMGTGMEMLAGSAGLYLTSLAAGEWKTFDITTVAARSWLALLYLIVFGSLIAFVAYTWLLRNAPVSLVSTYAYVNPLVAILLGAWLAQETLTPDVILAAAIIIGSVVLVNLGRQKQAPPPAVLSAD